MVPYFFRARCEDNADRCKNMLCSVTGWHLCRFTGEFWKAGVKDIKYDNFSLRIRKIFHPKNCKMQSWRWASAHWPKTSKTLFGPVNISVFISSPYQMQCELLPSLGVCRPLTFHILIFSSETAWSNEPKLGRKHLWKVLYKDC